MTNDPERELAQARIRLDAADAELARWSERRNWWRNRVAQLEAEAEEAKRR